MRTRTNPITSMVSKLIFVVVGQVILDLNTEEVENISGCRIDENRWNRKTSTIKVWINEINVNRNRSAEKRNRERPFILWDDFESCLTLKRVTFEKKSVVVYIKYYLSPHVCKSITESKNISPAGQASMFCFSFRNEICPVTGKYINDW